MITEKLFGFMQKKPVSAAGANTGVVLVTNSFKAVSMHDLCPL